MENIAKLAEALSKAQGKIKPPVKNREVDFTYEGVRTHYHYADLADVIEAIKEAFMENGLSHFHRLGLNPQGKYGMTTVIVHTSGESIDTWYPLPDPMGFKKPQGFGSLLTYARRYSLSSLVGVASEEDDDGRASQEREKTKPKDTDVEKKKRQDEWAAKKAREDKAKADAAKKPFDPKIPNAAKPKTDADIVAEKTEAEIQAHDQKQFALKALKELATSRAIANEDMIKVIQKVTLGRASDSKSMTVMEIERVMRYINNEDQNGNAVNASTVYQNGSGGSYETPALN